MKLLLLAAFLLNGNAPDPVTNAHSRSVDTKASTIQWTGHKVTGTHTGKVNIKSGEIAIHDGVIIGGSFSIDMTSITCEDLDAATGAKLIGHLNSDDFFNSANFPTASLRITKAIPQDTKGNHKVIGDLTIKGITKLIKFFAQVTKENGRDIAVADIKVDRSEYDVRYGSGSFFDNLGDKTIYDEFDLKVRLVIK